MNAHVTEFPSPVMANIRAFVSLARRQSWWSLEKARWAAEARLGGNPVAADRWAAESRRLRESATWHIRHAMQWKDGRNG